jgi:hypothetical protein
MVGIHLWLDQLVQTTLLLRERAKAMTNRRTGARLLWKVLLSLVLVTLFSEAVFRLVISSPCTQEFDRELGYVNIPFARYIESIEGYSITRFNSIGWNDREPMWGAKTPTILVVGDSFTEAFQVSRDKGYAQVAEDYVNRQAHGKAIDVIRLGRDGFTPVHYPFVVRRYVKQFDPALIVLQFSPVSGEGLYGEETAAVYDAEGGVRSLRVTPKLEDNQKEQFRAFVNNSAILYYLMRKYKQTFMKEKDGREVGARRSESDAGVVRQRSHQREDMVRRLEFVIDDIRSCGKKVAILYLPPPSIYIESGTTKHDGMFDVFRRISAERRIPLIDVSDEFIRQYKNRERMLYGFSNSLPGKGHLNVEGHAIVGEKLGGFLMTTLDIR